MIYKDTDNKDAVLAILEKMLALAGADKKALIERELRIMRAGVKGERESAYLIDFHLKDSTRTAVVHDLRLVLDDGRVAQIDHLLIHRTRRIYILETKHFAHGVKITEQGEFLRWNDWKKTYEGMSSPLAQNERHALVLRKVLESIGLGESPIETLVLVAPEARIDRPRKFDTSQVVKADQFMERLHKSLEGAPMLTALSGLLKNTVSDSIGDIAKKLVALHRPSTSDYMARFGVQREALLQAAPAPARTDPAPPRPAAPSAGMEREPALATAAPAHTGPRVVIQPQASAARLSAHGAATPASARAVAPAAPEPDAQPHACRSCGGAALSIVWGKYGYYFKCGECSGNTPFSVGCGGADHKERIRKDGRQFYRECADCGTSSLYFTNPQ
ncbi:nuclease-related domain-containing protein [Massilia brevitalea]|uniref:nuclease-related domain-containing protein n=1 Tax=Massilia brevitalea TaxID=442526 RepID=UPI002739EAB3|nr:nuclease-related domain-containing protein [Massilia brevitalea]